MKRYFSCLGICSTVTQCFSFMIHSNFYVPSCSKCFTYIHRFNPQDIHKKYDYYSHFIDEETEAQRGSSLPTVTQLGCGGARVGTRAHRPRIRVFLSVVDGSRSAADYILRLAFAWCGTRYPVPSQRSVTEVETRG